jgi:hypothetical protein
VATNLKHSIILGFAALCLHINLHAQTFSVELDTNRIRVGEQTTLFLDFALPGGWVPGTESLAWPSFSDTLTQQIEIVERSSLDTVQVDEQYHLRQTLTLTSFDTGYFVIRPITLTFSDQTFETTPQLLYCQGVEFDPNGTIREGRDIREVEYTLWDRLAENIFFILAGLACALIVFFVVRKLKQRAAHPAVQAETLTKPKASPEDEALERLADLQTRRVWQNGNIKAYHVEITDILRTYLERRYQVSTLERTSREILNELRTRGIDADAFAQLKMTFEIADMVKFARYRALPEENDGVMDNAISFVKTTRKTSNQTA